MFSSFIVLVFSYFLISTIASANLISGVNTTQNTNITNAGTYANSAFATANTGSASGSYANSAFAKANTAGTGTVTSVATGNGLSGGTITSTGTLVIAAPSYNSVGSYVQCYTNTNGINGGTTYAAGTGSSQLQAYVASLCGAAGTNNLSGSWRVMAGNNNSGYLYGGMLCVRVA